MPGLSLRRRESTALRRVLSFLWERREHCSAQSAVLSSRIRERALLCAECCPPSVHTLGTPRACLPDTLPTRFTVGRCCCRRGGFLGSSTTVGRAPRGALAALNYPFHCWSVRLASREGRLPWCISHLATLGCRPVLLLPCPVPSLRCTPVCICSSSSSCRRCTCSLVLPICTVSPHTGAGRPLPALLMHRFLRTEREDPPRTAL